jgi:hypothetical protein
MEKYLKYKLKYILLSGSRSTIGSRSTGKEYHASGVCLIEEKYTRGNKPTEPAYIFYRIRGSDIWEILGGKYDSRKDTGSYRIAATMSSAVFVLAACASLIWSTRHFSCRTLRSHLVTHTIHRSSAPAASTCVIQ